MAPELRHAGNAFKALQDRIGISDEQIANVARSDGEAYMPHAEFLKLQPPHWSEGEEPCDGMLRIDDQSGVLWPCTCDKCGFEVGVQVQKIDPQRLTDHRLSRAELPELAMKEFEEHEDQADALRACRQWIRQFKRGGVPAPALWGQPGRGKSHLLSLIGRALVENYGVDVLYRSASVLLDELQAGLDRGGYEQRWQRVLRAGVLVLDDLGAQRRTGWRDDRLAQLVDFRYQRELPLLIATNNHPGKWVADFGERTASRMQGMTFALRLAGPDRRAGQGVQQTLEGAPA